MASAALHEPVLDQLRTLADLQAYLGGIPTSRIRLKPVPGTGTEQDLLTILAKDERICELIDGIVVEKPMASYESYLGMVLGYFLMRFLDKHDLGVVLDAKGYLRLYPGRVRVPDVCFIAWKRMPNRECPDEKIWSLAPDLAVEILSEDNTVAEMERKLHDYFNAGSKLVWYVDPKARTVRVYTSVRKSIALTEADTLDGMKVLPGFKLPIKKWFARASRKPRK
jgi:Uma2 family endonuclease